eukprot:scaffold1388_cov390-Prasinococcus_capsulatus_cf.AAC.29
MVASVPQERDKMLPGGASGPQEGPIGHGARRNNSSASVRCALERLGGAGSQAERPRPGRPVPCQRAATAGPTVGTRSAADHLQTRIIHLAYRCPPLAAPLERARPPPGAAGDADM